MIQGRFAGMCGMSRFHVCCLLTTSENEEDEYLKGPPPPEEYLVSTEENILDTFSGIARNAVEQDILRPSTKVEFIEDEEAANGETTEAQVTTEKAISEATRPTIYVTPNTEVVDTTLGNVNFSLNITHKGAYL